MGAAAVGPSSRSAASSSFGWPSTRSSRISRPTRPISCDGVPSAMIVPWSMIATRSHTVCASSKRQSPIRSRRAGMDPDQRRAPQRGSTGWPELRAARRERRVRAQRRRHQAVHHDRHRPHTPMRSSRSNRTSSTTWPRSGSPCARPASTQSSRAIAPPGRRSSTRSAAHTSVTRMLPRTALFEGRARAPSPTPIPGG
jgi:hypothetical protein